MTPSTGSYEREVRDILYDEGWEVYRVAGSGTESGDSCDIVAMKDTLTLLIEVKNYRSGSGNVDCVEDMLQLRRQREKIDNCLTVFVHREIGGGTWYYEDSEMGLIDPDEEYGKFRDFVRHVENE